MIDKNKKNQQKIMLYEFESKLEAKSLIILQQKLKDKFQEQILKCTVKLEQKVLNKLFF